MTCPYIITPRWLVTMTDRTVREGLAVWIENGVIRQITSAENLPPWIPQKKLPHHVLMPGLINAHTHVGMNLLRGQGSDLPLMPWLETAIWPLEDKFVDGKFVHDSSWLAGVEMVAGGTTTCNDMYMCPRETIEGLRRSGMRMAIAGVIVKFPNPLIGRTERERLRFTQGLRDEYQDDPLIKITLGPHAPYTVTDDGLRGTAAMSQAENMLIHMHVCETQDEIDKSLEEFNMRPIARLEKADMITPRFIGVHAVHLLDEEIALLKARGASVVHCPSSNMKLASGFAPTSKFIEHKLNWAIGTDGAASNDKLDMWAEMRLAALLGKGSSGRADAVGAWDVLEAATIGGAKALHWETQIGSIAPGKDADLIAITMRDANVWPVTDIPAQLVYSADRHQVTNTWVKGKSVYERKSFNLLGSELERRVKTWETLLKR